MEDEEDIFADDQDIDDIAVILDEGTPEDSDQEEEEGN